MIRPAPLLYWFPGRLEPSPEYAGRFRDESGAERGCFSRSSEGPAKGIRGCLASPMHDVFVVYRPEVQRWDRLAPGVWIGAVKSAVPADFARPRLYNGYHRTLGDGNEWVIPIANPFAALCSLPAHDVLCDGSWRRQIAERYLDLSERAAALACEVRTRVLDGRTEGLEMPDDELRQLMADVLGLNYDLTVEEMSVLRLFDPTVNWPVVSAFIDWENTRQALADAAAESARTGGPFGESGPPATSGTPATAPPDAGIA